MKTTGEDITTANCPYMPYRLEKHLLKKRYGKQTIFLIYLLSELFILIT